MKIKKWWWKNFASYGNVEHSVEFLDDKGELILLFGKNGSAKSSLIKNMDFSFFGECLNDRGKKLTQKLIPNRDNGNMECGVNFYSKNNENCTIKRFLSSSLKTELTVDGEKYDKAGKIQSRIQELIGYDFDTYKSFISLNMNIFKDFINLTPEDKRTILDKLFNLQIINELNKVLKNLKSQNDTLYTSITREIKVYEEQIEMLKDSIKAASSIIVINNEDKIKELKQKIAENKEAYILIEDTKNTLNEKYKLEDQAYGELKVKRNEINRDILEIQKQIDLFNSGKCPTCGTDLSVQLDIKSDLEKRLNKTNEILSVLDDTIKKAKDNLNKLNEELNEAEDKFDSLTSLLTSFKSKISFLKEEQEENKQNDQLDIFKTNLDKSVDKYNNKKDEFVETQKLKYVYDTLSPIWGENGIKRDILENIIGPINNYIQEDLGIVGSRFNVELDNNFDVHITEWTTEIDSDTLSTGEAKKINLIIMLAYVKMIRLKNNINMLVLDELFSGIDVESVDFILRLMKKYANERGINIIIVHHSELNKSLFDRIITVTKTHYSQIEDERINNN